MENFAYYILKFFSFSFLALGITYLYNGDINSAVLALLSLVAVRYIDSKKYYDKYWNKNLEKRQVASCLFLFILNMFFYNQYLMSRPYMVKATASQKKMYVVYEGELWKKISLCQTAHNNMVLSVINGKVVNSKEKSAVNAICSSAMLSINGMYVDKKAQMPNMVDVKMFEAKRNYFDAVSAITRFNYVNNDGYDKSLSTIVKYNQEQAFEKMNAIRKMLNLNMLPETDKEIFETIQ